jgi:TPR repeat protein
LAKDHPAFPYGFELRGRLQEYHYKDTRKANQDYLTAADLGAGWSQNRMGWNYMKGINVPVDYAKARHYLDLAASQGNQTAKENLVILDKLKKGE